MKAENWIKAENLYLLKHFTIREILQYEKVEAREQYAEAAARLNRYEKLTALFRNGGAA